MRLAVVVLGGRADVSFNVAVKAAASVAELKAAIEAAHARGLKVTGHLCSIGFREAAELGIDDLEHGFEVDTEFFPAKLAW